MGLGRITVVFSVISSLFLLSQARFILDDFSSTAVAVRDPPEDADRKAIVPLEKPSSADESTPAVEGFHHVNISLRRPVDHHFLRPIDHQFLPRETRRGSGMIGFLRRLRGEMRWIPTRKMPEADDASGKLEETLAQDLTEVHPEETKEWIPIEWKAAEEEEEHKRKKKKRDKKEREDDSDSDSDSDDDDEEEEIKKKKRAKNGGLMKRFWGFLNRF